MRGRAVAFISLARKAPANVKDLKDGRVGSNGCAQLNCQRTTAWAFWLAKSGLTPNEATMREKSSQAARPEMITISSTVIRMQDAFAGHIVAIVGDCYATTNFRATNASA
jgi:hypothetical protein